MNTPLERLKALRDRLLSMDSASGEAADLALALAVIGAAQETMECSGSDALDPALEHLWDRVDALNTPDRGDTK